MDSRRWKIVAGTAGAVVVLGGVGVAAAATDGFNLRDQGDPVPVENEPPTAPDPSGTIDDSPESADSPNESVTDSPADMPTGTDASPETADSPNQSPTDSPAR